MTVETEHSYVEQTGNGSNKDFPFDFETEPDSSHIKVYLVTIATGDIVELDGNMTVTFANGGEDGGNVHYPDSGSAIASTHKLRIFRILPLEQSLDISPQGGFNPTTLEAQLDRISFQIQQLKTSSIQAATGEVLSTLAEKTLLGRRSGSSGGVDVISLGDDLEISSKELALAATGVVPGQYGASNKFPYFTLDSKGRITAVGETTLNPSSLQAAFNERTRVEGYIPNYNLDDDHVEDGGSDLSVHMPFDMGTHTLPSGANKQHVGIRFIGTFTNEDDFETAGAKAISFSLNSYNADLYGIIGAVTLKGGAKGIKAIYGRGIIESTDPDIGGDNGVVGLVGGATIAVAGTNATTAWALQLTLDGAYDLSTLANQRIQSWGTDQAYKKAGYGIYSDPNLRYSTAMIRGFWTNDAGDPATGHFLLWQQKDGGGAGVHTDIFRVSYDGRARIGDGTVGEGGIHFANDTDTGIYRTGTNAMGFATAGGIRMRINATGPIFYPASSVSLSVNGEVSLEFTNNTTITIKGRGTDGVTRTQALTIA